MASFTLLSNQQSSLFRIWTSVTSKDCPFVLGTQINCWVWIQKSWPLMLCHYWNIGSFSTVFGTRCSRVCWLPRSWQEKCVQGPVQFQNFGDCFFGVTCRFFYVCRQLITTKDLMMNFVWLVVLTFTFPPCVLDTIQTTTAEIIRPLCHSRVLPLSCCRTHHLFSSSDQLSATLT